MFPLGGFLGLPGTDLSLEVVPGRWLLGGEFAMKILSGLNRVGRQSGVRCAIVANKEMRKRTREFNAAAQA
jgi:hypothetical protein